MTTTDHQISYNAYDVYRLLLFCACDRSVRYTEAGLTRHLLDVGRDEGRQDGYDVGLAAAKGELVAVDDPRIKKQGARARLELVHPPSRKSEAYEGIVTHDMMGRPVVCGCLVMGSTVGAVYLLSEAPDPDAEVREALAAVMGNGDPVGSDDLRSADGLLDALRALNFDVVKAVAK